MPRLLFTCPAAGRSVSTGIEADAESVRKCWHQTLEIRSCPHCGEAHKISVRQTFFDSTVDYALLTKLEARQRYDLDRGTGR
jgi:hypothetical protein